MVAVPSMITDPGERAKYLVQHYWDKFDFTDTAYIHLPDITEQALTNYIDLMKYVDEINMKYGGEGTKLYSTTGTHFKKLCLQNKLSLLDASVRHLGTDINYIVLENLYADLKDKVDFI